VIELTLGQVAAAVGGRLHAAGGDEVVTGTVEFDSRQVGPGGLFVALPGERVDGHEFAAAALAAGAVGVLAARPAGSDVPTVIVPPLSGTGQAGATVSYVLAADPAGQGAAVLAGLGRLARAVVDRLAGSLTVIGVTGSSGKTTTKDLLAGLLAPMGPTVAPPGSFNNELGHPWTVLRADRRTRHLVLELSARDAGHIAALCALAPPRIGVVLGVGSAHLGVFGSREAIARAKGELVEALPAAADGGVAVLNADDPLVAAMAGRTAARVVLAGRTERAQVRALDVRLDGQGRAGFTLDCPAGRAPVRLALHGEHQVGNALSAAAVALELGATPEQVADRLTRAGPASRWRMEVSRRADGLTVINDAYNANPESVTAALRTLAAMGRESGGRTWAVLGEMAELGPHGPAAHREIGRLAASLGIDRVVAVGAADATEVRDGVLGAAGEGPDPAGTGRAGAGEEPVLVPDVRAAVAITLDGVRPGDVVLVKASRVAGLERLAEALLAAGPANGPAVRGNGPAVRGNGAAPGGGR
jgi:UDP-N-acetylmuramoyl-tripeptide--D-alanyl-D-alanine ligase